MSELRRLSEYGSSCRAGQTVRTKMAETHPLPMLPLDDVVVLPGMVVPVSMSDSEVRAAVEAAQASTGATEAAGENGQPRVLLVPRLDGRYSGYGTVGVIEQ